MDNLKNFDDEGPAPRVAQLGATARAINEAASDRGLRPAAPLGAAARMSGREMLCQRAARLKHEANGIDALLKALPMELPEQADYALWDLVMKARG